MVARTFLPSEQDAFAAFGLESLVYVRKERVQGRSVHVIHAADGTPLSMSLSRNQAFATVRQYELHPLSVH